MKKKKEKASCVPPVRCWLCSSSLSFPVSPSAPKGQGGEAKQRPKGVKRDGRKGVSKRLSRRCRLNGQRAGRRGAAPAVSFCFVSHLSRPPLMTRAIRHIVGPIGTDENFFPLLWQSECRRLLAAATTSGRKEGRTRFKGAEKPLLGEEKKEAIALIGSTRYVGARTEMKAIVAAMERAAQAIGVGAKALPTPADATMLNELEALWQPMVAVPRTIAIKRGTFYADDGAHATTCAVAERAGTPAHTASAAASSSAAWCVIDLDSRVLSCESRGLWWDPFVIVSPADPSLSSSLSSSLSLSSSGERALSCGRANDSHDSDHRVLLQSVNQAHAASWWCEIVRGPHARGAERSIYYTNLTFSDVAIEPQRGVISGARLRTRNQKSGA